MIWSFVIAGARTWLSPVHIMVPIASKESVRQFYFFIIRGPRLGWFDGCIGVKMEFPSAQVEVKAKKEDKSFETDARAAV